MIDQLQELDWVEVLKQIQGFTSSGTGRIQAGALTPAVSASEATRRMEDVFDAIQILAMGPRPFMESLDLFEGWHSRLKRKAILKTLEIKDVRSFCLEVIALSETLAQSPRRWSEEILQALMPATEPLSAIDQLITARGDIRSDASETLFRLTREKENLTRQIETTLDGLVKTHDMHGYLQDRFVTTREGRWVLPIRSGRQHAVEGVIHGSSQTKQTVYMEPGAVIPLNNRLRQVEVEIEEEIERLLQQISEYLAQLAEAFQRTHEHMLIADVTLAKAQWSQLIQAKTFSFANDQLDLRDVCHPLMQVATRKPVPNSVSLTDDKTILLLSGPNAGGKTVLLKAIGLAAQMARCGLPICAGESSRLPFFERIHIGIGDSQSVDAELSTFAAHIQVLQKATALNGKQNLILIDEICGSTDPEEGAALARSFIERFAEQNCLAIITSHLGPLKSGWPSEGAVMSGSMEYNSRSGQPTYTFLPGIPGDSLAIQTAKRVGVGDQIVNRAIELLSPTTRSRLAGLEEIEQLKSDIQTLREHLKTETKKTQAEHQRLLQEKELFEQEKDKNLQKLVRQYERQIDDLIAESKVEQTFKKHQSLQNLKSELPQIVKSRSGSGQPQSAPTDKPPSADEFTKRFPPGTKLFVPTLGQDGIVQSRPNAKGEVLVLANSIRLAVPWQSLQPAASAGNPTGQILRRTIGYAAGLNDQERSVDLRGLTVEDALTELERQLDLATLQQEDRIKVIHGHGTEALKKSVRTFLSRSAIVKKWKAGSPEQGGDGMTWVELGSD